MPKSITTKETNAKTRADLLAYVGKWFDECEKIGPLDDGFPMGKLVIHITDCGMGRHETTYEPVIDVQVERTMPLEAV